MLKNILCHAEFSSASFLIYKILKQVQDDTIIFSFFPISKTALGMRKNEIFSDKINSCMSELEKAQKRAWRWYKERSVRKIYATTLKKFIRLTNKGWSHLIGNKRKVARPTPDLIHRFHILKYAEAVVQRGTYVGSIKRDGVIFHSIDYDIENMRLRVVIIEDARGYLSFLSIMEKTKKTAPLTLPKH
jgi:hypothetical protein